MIEAKEKPSAHQCDDHRRKLRTVQIKNHRQYLLKVKKANKELTKKEAFKDLLNQL
jgi:hypothetical protein